jgi:hypothetical protein
MVNTITVNLTQPSPIINWNDFVNSLNDYLTTTYIDSGKIVSIQTTISDDELTFYRKLVFQDQTALDTFLSDPIIVTAIFDRNKLLRSSGGTVDAVIS